MSVILTPERIADICARHLSAAEGEPEARLVAFGRRDALDTIARRVGGGYVREVAS